MLKLFLSLVKRTIKSLLYFKTYLGAFLNLYVFRKHKCYICGKKNLIIHLVNWKRYIIKCEFCELIFVGTPPKLNSLKRIHDTAYWKKIEEELGCCKKPLAWEDWKGWKNHLLNYFNIDGIEKELGGQRKILDIGCGNGKLLELFCHRGWECTGIDFGGYIRGLKFQSGLNIINFSFEHAVFSEKHFDFIAMTHVLEHFANPVVCLEKTRKILKDTGYLLIETPLVVDYEDLHHQSFYNRESLYNLLEKLRMSALKEKTYRDELRLERENIVLLCQKKETL